MYEAPILATAEILSVLKPELCEVRLPNGKKSLGHLSKALRQTGTELQIGDQVTVELTPFDFDTARISEILTP
ncbi:MAG: translation initiation factor IF-1 [Verrucomicrobiales bacterium]